MSESAVEVQTTAQIELQLKRAVLLPVVWCTLGNGHELVPAVHRAEDGTVLVMCPEHQALLNLDEDVDVIRLLEPGA